MSDNPYSAPLTNAPRETPPANGLALIGCVIGAGGFVALLASAHSTFAWLLSVACVAGPLGLAVSLLALAKKPRRAAAWGGAIGLAVTLYLLSLLLGLLFG